MRLFIALELNAKVVANLTELVRRLGPVSPISWVHPHNMHVTLKYVGEWPEQRLPVLTESLTEVKLDTPITVPLAGLGFFPSAAAPRIFWAGAENTPGLRRLASGVDAQLQPLGIAPEVRPYQPHLPLGRMLEHDSLRGMYEAIEELPSREFGAITPDRFVMYESSSSPDGSVYRRIEEFPFLTPQARQARPRRARYASAFWSEPQA